MLCLSANKWVEAFNLLHDTNDSHGNLLVFAAYENVPHQSFYKMTKSFVEPYSIKQVKVVKDEK